MPICGCLLKWRQSGGNESLTCGVKVLPREPLTRDSIRIGLSHIAGVVELVSVGEKNACRENESNPNKGKLMKSFLESKALHFNSHEPH